MYKLIGNDQKIYGPVDSAKVLQWLQEGRANHETLVQEENSKYWVPLASVPEFAPYFSPAPGVLPPPPRPSGAHPPPPPSQKPPFPAAHNDSSRDAVLGLVFGIISLAPCCCLAGIVGIVYSVKALKGPQQEGRALAIAGLILSLIGLFGGALWTPFKGHSRDLFFNRHLFPQ
jgi:hypothetical protein